MIVIIGLYAIRSPRNFSIQIRLPQLVFVRELLRLTQKKEVKLFKKVIFWTAGPKIAHPRDYQLPLGTREINSSNF